MRRTAGYSASSVLAVQSPVAEIISSGRGAVVDGREQERLRAAPRLAGDRERVALDVGERLEEVQAADRVPQLQSPEAQPPQRFAFAAEGMRQLPAVVVADHV